jgi:glycosyltransferase involved in cell wall biosynthesis
VNSRVDVSVVVPVFNELENLEELYSQLTKAMDRREYELLFVDDGSTDASYEILAHLHAKDRRVKVVQLAENFGQHAALAAGIEHAHGEAIVTMDADLQRDPTDIALLLAKMAEGYEVVSGLADRAERRLSYPPVSILFREQNHWDGDRYSSSRL